MYIGVIHNGKECSNRNRFNSLVYVLKYENRHVFAHFEQQPNQTEQ